MGVTWGASWGASCGTTWDRVASTRRLVGRTIVRGGGITGDRLRRYQIEHPKPPQPAPPQPKRPPPVPPGMTAAVESLPAPVVPRAVVKVEAVQKNDEDFRRKELARRRAEREEEAFVNALLAAETRAMRRAVKRLGAWILERAGQWTI
jgi:hypothetical protein